MTGRFVRAGLKMLLKSLKKIYWDEIYWDEISKTNVYR
jgi:hypothetical protein